MSNEPAKTECTNTDVKDMPNQDAKTWESAKEVTVGPSIGKEDANRHGSSGNNDKKGDVNMEAIIISDDVIRAGGFGATDGISSFLPVAVDSTDFEASLRDARDFEEPQGEISHPGLGWTEIAESEDG